MGGGEDSHNNDEKDTTEELTFTSVGKFTLVYTDTHQSL